MRNKCLFVCLISFFITFSISADDHSDYRASYSLFRDELYDVAERSLNDFIKKYPTSIYMDRVLYTLSLAKMKNGDVKGSIASLEKLMTIKDFEYGDDVLYYLMINYHQTGKYADSDRLYPIAFDRIKDVDRQEKLLYTAFKNAVYSSNDSLAFERAIRYNQNQAFKNYKADIYMFLSDLYLRNADYSNALIHMDVMITEVKLSAEDRVRINYNYLYALTMLSRDQEAVNFFDRTKPAYSSSTFIIVADALYRLKDYNRAYNMLDIVYEAEKKPAIAFKQAIILSELKKFTEALNLLENRSGNLDYIYEKALLARKAQLNKRGLEILKRKNITTYLRDELLLYSDFMGYLADVEAVKTFVDAIQISSILLNSERNSMLYNSTVMLFNANEYPRALKAMNMWLKEFSTDLLYDRMLFMSGVAYKKLKEYHQAITQFAKLQRLKKNDLYFYESYVEKGECQFLLREYEPAIKSYEVYLSNKTTDSRKKEALLQMANSYYNIKKYKDAYSLYERYRQQYGEDNAVYSKIASTLLKGSSYKEAEKYFAAKKNIGDYAFFVYLYSAFKNESFANVFAELPQVLKFKDSKYFSEMLYIIVLSGQKIGEHSALISLYNKNRLIILASDNKIKHALLISFLKKRDISSLNEMFKNPDADLSYSLGETLADYQFHKEARQFFKKSLSTESLIDYRKLLRMYRFFRQEEFYNDAIFVIEKIEKQFPTLDDANAYRYAVYCDMNNVEGLVALSNKLSASEMLQQMIKERIAYSQKMNESAYLNGLFALITDADIDKVATKELIKQILYFSLKNNDLKKAAKIVDKIPSSKMNSLDADTRLMEAELYEKSGNTQKAIDLYLRLFYIYPSDVSVVHQAIKRVVSYYAENGDVDRSLRIKKMFEEKYFDL